CRRTYLLVREVHHLLAVQPRGHLVALGPYFHGIPLIRLQYLFFFRVGFDQPTAAVGFIDPTGGMARRRHLYLPAFYFYPFDIRADKYPAVSVRLQFEGHP